jgi:hypothetical protein
MNGRNEMTKNWNLDLETNLVRVEGRLLAKLGTCPTGWIVDRLFRGSYSARTVFGNRVFDSADDAAVAVADWY